MSAPVERIREGTVDVVIVRSGWQPGETSFVTEAEASLQVGHVVYPAGGEVRPHEHVPQARSLTDTAEVVVVLRGACVLDLYDAGALVASRPLEAGDTAVLLRGGHGFRMQADTELLEVKQGPYTGVDEKRHFEP